MPPPVAPPAYGDEVNPGMNNPKDFSIGSGAMGCTARPVWETGALDMLCAGLFTKG